jgi:lysine-specific demethylase/histidyl-hydroxylase NO66
MGVDLADPQLLAEHLHLVADRMAMAARSPDKVLDRAAGMLGSDLRSATRPAPLEPLAQLALLTDLDAQAPLRRRPGLRFVLSDDGCSITALDKTVTLPAPLARAAKVLLDGAVHTAAELTELGAGDQLVLARRLLREGLLVPAPVGQAWGG